MSSLESRGSKITNKEWKSLEFSTSRNLKPPKRNKPLQKTSAPTVPQQGSPRRSSRLKVMTPISYSEKRTPKKAEQFYPELYTEEHEKLLGDCKTSWPVLVDGFGKDGQLRYDQHQGKNCHQCRQKSRQKTLGLRTACRKCKRQFCGDCLYVRYGENILEVNENQDWVCPVCRGICNCSCCRRA